MIDNTFPVDHVMALHGFGNKQLFTPKWSPSKLGYAYLYNKAEMKQS